MKKILPLFVTLIFVCSVSAQNYTIQQYLNIKSASAPTVSPDGKRLLYLTNITGTSQIYAVDLPDGKPKQMTNYDDNIGFVKFSPKGDLLIFGKAKGGDENTQFFTMKPDGGAVKELTANPKVRYNFGDWSDDGARIYYASNKRDKNFFDVYAMNIGDGKEELLYQSDGNNDFAAASKNGKKIIISRSGTELSLDNNLYLVDTKTKTETLLTPHEGASQFANVKFVSNNEVNLTMNDKREFMTFATMFPDQKMTQTGDDSPNAQWDLEDVEISPNGGTQARVTNHEGFSDLEIYHRSVNGKGLTKETVKLPAQGIVGGLSFSKDGSKLAFAFNSSKNNSDVWMYDVKSKNLTQITKSDRAGIDQESFKEPTLIKYKTFDGREIPAWYYVPKIYTEGRIIDVGYTSKNESATKLESDSNNAQNKSKNIDLKVKEIYKKWLNQAVPVLIAPKEIPVLISVHGGPEGQERPTFNPLYQYYLSRGYAILATNVRGSTGYGKTYTHLDDVYKREDSIKDLAFAAEWLKTSGGADAKRIGIMGGSYGGYATLAAITLYPDLFAAAVDTVGIANWESFFKNTSGYRKRQREVEYGMGDKDAEFLRSISPITKADKIKTPLFVIAGKNDPRVPYTEAEQIVKAVKDNGGIVQYKLYDDEGHGIAKLKNRLELYPLVADFLDKYMK